jgi:hypothetical protein
MAAQVGRSEWRRLRVLLVLTLIVLTVQGWTGDTTNLFATTTTTASSSSLPGAVQTIENAGPILVWHATEGMLVLALSLVVLAMSIRSKPRSVRVCAILGTLAVVSALIGGLSFVLSGFQDSGSSAQMGGSFIGAYAFYFIELYFAK